MISTNDENREEITYFKVNHSDLVLTRSDAVVECKKVDDLVVFDEIDSIKNQLLNMARSVSFEFVLIFLSYQFN